MAQNDKKKLRYRLLWIVPVVSISLLLAVFIGQEKKLQQIKLKQEAANQELLELENEETRIKRMIEYAKTEEYRLEYAREALGFVMPDDIKIELEKD